MARRSLTAWLGCWMLVAAGAAMPAVGQGANPILLSVGEGTGNAGDTALVPIELSVGNTRPTNMVVWLRYNPAKIQPDATAFEIPAVDLEGNPIRDERGNVITVRSAVRSEQVLIDAEKQIDSEVHEEGALGIAIQGLNSANIAPGAMLTVAFKIQPGVAENEVIAVEGAEVTDPVQFTENGSLQSASTSANYKQPNDTLAELGVEVSDGRVVVPCATPAAPTNVQATQGQPDAVVVTWTASTLPGAEYRVYRSETNNPGNAVPLGSNSQSATTFTDITALAPVTPTGCACNATPTFVHYFYFVRTVNAAGCESEFSTPGADGYRGTAKAASALAKTAIDTLPSAAYDTGANVAHAGEAVAVRLEGATPGTIWAEATDGVWSSAKIRWIADGADAGWAAIDLPASLAEGTHVLLTAGADNAGPVVREFVVAAAVKSAGATVEDLGLDAVPYLPEGVGTVYRVAPASVLGAPLTVYLPVPDGEDADVLFVYTYIADQGDRRWYVGENVSGWLASAPVVEEHNGAPHVRIQVRYGGIVQLGHTASPAVRAAGIAPANLARLHAGDLVVLCVGTFLLLAATRRARNNQG